MDPVSNTNPRTREFITEILDESQWPNTLQSVIAVLRKNRVETVKLEFGFVLARDLRGEEQMKDAFVSLDTLQSFIESGLEEGTIEWSGDSNFVFSPIGSDLRFMLCNDADLHFSSADMVLLAEISRALIACGVKVYDSGKLVSPDSY